LERLHVLHAVATTGSVTSAARSLHVTSSAVSQQLARLEREVGQRLVEKAGRGVRLTQAGVVLARDAGELLSQVERVEATLAEHRGVVAGTLNVAAFATAARGLLPGVLAELRGRFAELRVSLAELEPHEAIPACARGQVDIAIVQDWRSGGAGDELALPDGLTRRDLLDDVFDVALPHDHPSADRDELAITELLDEDWIGWTSGQICHDWLLRTLALHSAQARVSHTASEHSTQLALVAAGLGVALIPRLGRDPIPAGVRFARLTPAPVRRVFAVWRTSASARPAIGAMLAALDGEAASMST
jgi:molybdate transport repressor ModE-like protein